MISDSAGPVAPASADEARKDLLAGKIDFRNKPKSAETQARVLA
jgi:hypothetical protein